MKEVKSSKKPLIYYYCIVLLIIFLFNMFITPLLTRGQVTEVDYGTFMRMTDERQITPGAGERACTPGAFRSKMAGPRREGEICQVRKARMARARSLPDARAGLVAESSV